MRGALQLLRVLSRGRAQRRVRARVRRDLQEDRRNPGTWWRAVAAAGWAQSRLAAGVVRGSVPRGQATIPGFQTARLITAGSAAHFADVEAVRARSHRAADR